jgi:hypothetical protein
MVRRNVLGGVVCHLRIWYRHSLRGKKNLTAHPSGRAHQPSGASACISSGTSLVRIKSSRQGLRYLVERMP